jgi:hypothetical protein
LEVAPSSTALSSPLLEEDPDDVDPDEVDPDEEEELENPPFPPSLPLNALYPGPEPPQPA